MLEVVLLTQWICIWAYKKMFIYRLYNNTVYDIRLFSDDTSLHIIVEYLNVTAELLNADLQKIAEWALNWLVKLTP